MELSTRSITRQMMMAQIEAYLQTLPEEDRWKDFFESSIGKTLLDILTGISELLLYKLEIRSLDSYLPTALSKSATYLLAQMVGYNPNRKHHASGILRCKWLYVPTSDITIPKDFVLDYEKPLIVSENVTAKAGEEEFELPVMQGEWVYKEFSRSNGDFIGKEFEYIIIDEEDFTIDQFEMYITVDDNPVKVVDRIEIVDENSVIVRTDYQGGVILMFGDGIYGKRLEPNSIVKVKYLKTMGLDGYIPPDTQIGDFLYANNAFTAFTKTAIKGGSNEDSIEKVKYLASRFFQAQGRAVTKYDYEAVVMSHPGVVSARCLRIDDECCSICISALKEDFSEWNEEEIKELMDYLEEYKMVSTRVEFWQPEVVPLNLLIKVVVDPFYDLDIVKNAINEYLLSKYFYKLGQTFFSTKFIDDIADAVSGIKRVYLLSVNGNDCYPDIELPCYGFFAPGDITVVAETDLTRE